MKNAKEYLSKKNVIYAVQIILFLVISYFQYYAINLSADLYGDLPAISMQYRLIGYAVVLLVNMVLMLLFKRVRWAIYVSLLLTTALAVGNYYVYLLHGTPFSFLMLLNLSTAADVLSSYTITLDAIPVKILVIALVSVVLCKLIFKDAALDRLKSAGAVLVLSCVMYMSFFAADPLVPKNAVGWSWAVTLEEYGYTTGLVRNTINSFNSVIKPADYDEAILKTQVSEYEPQQREGSTPDFIFILNETFYDLRQITDVNPDMEYLDYLHELDNSIQGYAVTPQIGGGTNNSEYELLTSNSLCLAPGITPFNTLNMNGATSVVSFLKESGYETLGAHSETGNNYNRVSGYSGLGFEHAYFAEHFQDVSYYGDRWYETDESLYNNLFRWYEEMGEGPRAMYLLTIQNHGGYEQNDASYDLVHTGRDYGEETESVNEFLTSISFSDDAFSLLVDYFKDVDRDVVICMVGDHCPSFASGIVDEEYLEDEDLARLHLSSTPFVIWSNHIELERPEELPERMSMIYVLPTALEASGIQLSGFYDYLVELRDKVPVLSGFGKYYTADGEKYSYDEPSRYIGDIGTYFDMVYANMQRKPFMYDFVSVAPDFTEPVQETDAAEPAAEE